MQVKENCKNVLKVVVVFFMDRVDPYFLRWRRYHYYNHYHYHYHYHHRHYYSYYYQWHALGLVRIWSLL